MKKWLLAITLIATPAFAQQVPPEIAESCAKKWGTDYEMQVYCRDKQMKALKALQEQDGMASSQPNSGQYVDWVDLLKNTLEADIAYVCTPSYKVDQTVVGLANLSCEQAQRESTRRSIVAFEVLAKKPQKEVAHITGVSEHCVNTNKFGDHIDRVKLAGCMQNGLQEVTKSLEAQKNALLERLRRQADERAKKLGLTK